MDITPQQAAVLQRIIGQGFQIVAFPMYESYIGVRKGNCAALLAPQASGGLSIYGQPAYIVGGSFGVKMFEPDGHYFVSKKEKLAATPERTRELEEFSAELADALLPTA
jgi:hypothetical protein